jgi:hypothetical protein
VVQAVPEKKLGVVFNFNASAYPYFTVDAIQGDADEEVKNLPAKQKNWTYEICKHRSF